MELGTMQRRRTSRQIALVPHIKNIGIGKHDTEDKVFWDLTEDGIHSNKSNWSLITQRKPTEHNIAQILYSEGYSIQLLHSSQRENQGNMFFFMERQLNMCGSTLEAHW